MIGVFSEAIAAIYRGIFISPEAFMVLDIGSILFIAFFYIIIPIILVVIIGRIVFLAIKKASKAAALGMNLAQSDEDLDDLFGIAGYEYDAKQDIYYSVIDPWQRKFGYCRLYDEALAPLSMIVDCEPIIFECRGKRWMIEFWKGQYCLNTGCEIGIYREVADLSIIGVDGSFYTSVRDDELMNMAFSLKKNGKELFHREAKHWWLTGFKMGEFSNPSELSMDIAIQFNDLDMCYSFINALLNVGYSDEEVVKVGNTVYFTYGKPRTQQPMTRTRLTDWIVQRKNKIMCDQYKESTEEYSNMSTEEKLALLKVNNPELFKKVVKIGKSREVYKSYDRIKRYI